MIVGVILVVALIAFAFAYIGNIAGILVIFAVAAVGFWAVLHWDRRGPVEIAGPLPDQVRRTLVFVDVGAEGGSLADKLAGLEGDAARELHVVVPARTDTLHRAASDIDPARAEAERRLGELLTSLRARFDRVEGEVGDPEDRLALEDSLRVYPADELVVVNVPAERRDDLQAAVSARAERDVPLRLLELTAG